MECLHWSWSFWIFDPPILLNVKARLRALSGLCLPSIEEQDVCRGVLNLQTCEKCWHSRCFFPSPFYANHFYSGRVWRDGESLKVFVTQNEVFSVATDRTYSGKTSVVTSVSSLRNVKHSTPLPTPQHRPPPPKPGPTQSKVHNNSRGHCGMSTIRGVFPAQQSTFEC